MTFAESRKACLLWEEPDPHKGGRLEDGCDESSGGDECDDDVPPSFGGYGHSAERVDNNLEPFTYNGNHSNSTMSWHARTAWVRSMT